MVSLLFFLTTMIALCIQSVQDNRRELHLDEIRNISDKDGYFMLSSVK